MRKELSYAPVIAGAILLLFIAAALFRPLLPIDETRYMTVAWEMFLKHDYILPTMNFAPYHHKPPVLFWLINAAWHVFGVHRWSALAPFFLIALSFVWLTQELAKRLFADKKEIIKLVPWLVLGSLPFLIYSTMVMFDALMAVLVLAILIILIDFSREGRPWRVMLAGAIMGAALLTKGPVAFLYTLWPLVFYPFWRRDTDISNSKFYAAIAMAVLLSLGVAALWLAPLLHKVRGDFAFWLLWEQTAGRVTGSFGAAHSRPFYFYLLVLPVFLMPWVFFTALGQGARRIDVSHSGIRFLLVAIIPAFVSFSLIAGKQPHYLVPLMPFALLGMGWCLSDVPEKLIKSSALAMVALALLVNAGAGMTVLKKYDLLPFVEVYKQHKSADWAFVRNYQGEIGFLGRVGKPIHNMEIDDLDGWFREHPRGFALVRYNDSNKMTAYKEIISRSYKGKKLGIFRVADHGRH